MSQTVPSSTECGDGVPTVAISRRPRTVLALTLALPLLTGIPLYAGYLVQHPPERIFLGFRLFIADELMYASFARQSAIEGRFLMENRFAVGSQMRRYAPVYPWAIGLLSRLTGMKIPVAWEAARLLIGVVFLCLLWRMICSWLPEPIERSEAFCLIALSGGVGWIVAPFVDEGRPIGALLQRAWNPFWDFSTFGSLVGPMWLAATCVWLLVARVVTRPVRSSIAVWATGLALPPVAWSIHPYTGVLVYAALGVYAVLPAVTRRVTGGGLPWRELRARAGVVAPALMSVGIVAAYVTWARQDPTFRMSSDRAFAWTPRYPLIIYPLAYGLLLPLAVCGIAGRAGHYTRMDDLLLAWLVAAFLLSMNPFFAGVKFQYLLHIPLAGFATYGFFTLRRSAPLGTVLRGRASLFLAVLLFGHSAWTIARSTASTSIQPYLYISERELAALRFLEAQPKGLTLSAPISGNAIPWLAGKPVVAGHWFLTPNVDKKADIIAKFFSSKAELTWKHHVLNKFDVRYVYAGPVEHQLGDIDPRLGLACIYDSGGIQIFRAETEIAAKSTLASVGSHASF